MAIRTALVAHGGETGLEGRGIEDSPSLGHAANPRYDVVILQHDTLGFGAFGAGTSQDRVQATFAGDGRGTLGLGQAPRHLVVGRRQATARVRTCVRMSAHDGVHRGVHDGVDASVRDRSVVPAIHQRRGCPNSP